MLVGCNLDGVPNVRLSRMSVTSVSRYGANGACAKAGYDPAGGYLCSQHGGMHGGDYDAISGKWGCPGCTDG